jgi:hypothetical protein
LEPPIAQSQKYSGMDSIGKIGKLSWLAMDISCKKTNGRFTQGSKRVELTRMNLYSDNSHISEKTTITTHTSRRVTKYLGSSIVTEVLPWQYTSCHLLFSLLLPVLRNRHTLKIGMTYINSHPLERKTMVHQYQQKFQLIHL